MTSALAGSFRLGAAPARAAADPPAGESDFRDERLALDLSAGPLRARWLRAGPRFVLLLGEGPRGESANGGLAPLIDALARDTPAALARLCDPFVLFYSDAQRRRCVLATDRAATRGPCYAHERDRFAFGLSALDVERAQGAAATLRMQGIYDYLYFHVIPAPGTVFTGIDRVLPGHFVEADESGCRVAAYWTPTYVRDGPAPRFDAARAEFRALLRDAVSHAVDPGTTGTFLSGGTDSSTVAGVLAGLQPDPVATYSIGFDVAGFDEMAYAKIAADRFGTRHRICYLTPADLLGSVADIAGSYDQPFGNSSAAAAYLCAQTAAADGITTLLGGDGGDEIFGGNTRYAKQLVFDAYDRVPGAARTRLLEPLLLGSPRVARLPLLRKVARYVEQARVPMPDRMETYNLLDRVGAANMLAPGVLAAMDRQVPARLQRDWYAQCADPHLVNRMLHFDWKFTLSDNDLPKVVGTGDLAGVRIAFPLLDPALVAFGNALPARWKVRGPRLRWFFKRALADFLPGEIIRKRKHGFGLPFGAWVISDPALQRLARGSLESLRDRGLLQSAFVDDLMRPRLTEHATFYGELVWILMTLELWLVARRPAQRFG